MQFTSQMSVRICFYIILFAVQKRLSTLRLPRAHLSPRVPLFPPVPLSPPVPLFLPRVLRFLLRVPRFLLRVPRSLLRVPRFPLVLIFARGNKRKKKKECKKEISTCLINTGDLHRKWVTWQ